LAQAQWAAKDVGLEDSIRQDWLESPASAEAALYRALNLGDLATALEKSLAWHLDEPFASRPLVSASYLAAVTGDFLGAAVLARAGLAIEPDNNVLLNNLIFALLSQGKVDEALRYAATAFRQDPGADDPMIFANIGLMAYQCGDSDLGARAYAEAMRRYDKSGRIRHASMARIFHAFAVRNQPAALREQVQRDAEDAARRSKDLLIKSLAVSLAGLSPSAVAWPNRLNSDAKAKKWIYDRKKNLLLLD
jgi:Tfp pilus assembly protein PilF